MSLLVYIVGAGVVYWITNLIDRLRKRISSLETSQEMLIERLNRADDEIAWLREQSRERSP